MSEKKSRRKTGFIGASHLFVHQAIRDFILSGAMEETDIYIYDIDSEALAIECDLIARMIKDKKSGMTINACTSREEALDGADFMVVSVLVGGLDTAQKEDFICQKYGIRHTVGDTVGPMCTARCLRQVPLLVDIAQDMKKYCPGAPLLSPTNPMAVLTAAVIRYGGVDCIRICHGTHHALKIIADTYGTKI